MKVKVQSRVERGCGFRDKNGYYLVGYGTLLKCRRLPMEIPVCPCCGETIRFLRSIRHINALKIFGMCAHTVKEHPCHADKCFVCYPPEKAWLMWVGEKYYSPETFIAEAERYGVSKKIYRIPVDLRIGDIVYLAHKNGCGDEPGIIYAFTVTEIQKIIDNNEARDSDYINELNRNGITPVLEADETCNTFEVGWP